MNHQDRPRTDPLECERNARGRHRRSCHDHTPQQFKRNDSRACTAPCPGRIALLNADRSLPDACRGMAPRDRDQRELAHDNHSPAPPGPCSHAHIPIKSHNLPALRCRTAIHKHILPARNLPAAPYFGCFVLKIPYTKKTPSAERSVLANPDWFA
jgi:hypothetical protein